MIATGVDTGVEALLNEGTAGAAQRERSEFDRTAARVGGRFVLFGAGNLGRTIRRKLALAGIEPLAFADNNRKLWGTRVEGLEVLSPGDAASRFGHMAAFVVAIWGVGSQDRMAARVRQLRELGCRAVVPFVPLLWKYADLFLPYHVIDRPTNVHREVEAVTAAAGLWADDFSRCEYIAQLKWRLRGDFDSMADPVTEPIYFPRFCGIGSDEVFVDCGAFDGDTVRSFLTATRSQFHEILALEPDPDNCEKLRNCVAGLDVEVARRITVEQKAVGRKAGVVRFRATGTDGSAIADDGDVVAECVALDELARRRRVPTYIKMDIEGGELEALAGASELLAGHAPVLAICAYHRQSDLWRIPLLIHSFNPDYRFYLRPHLVEGWDVVCYAAPRQRQGRIAA